MFARCWQLIYDLNWAQAVVQKVWHQSIGLPVNNFFLKHKQTLGNLKYTFKYYLFVYFFLLIISILFLFINQKTFKISGLIIQSFAILSAILMPFIISKIPVYDSFGIKVEIIILQIAWSFVAVIAPLNLNLMKKFNFQLYFVIKKFTSMYGFFSNLFKIKKNEKFCKIFSKKPCFQLYFHHFICS